MYNQCWGYTLKHQGFTIQHIKNWFGSERLSVALWRFPTMFQIVNHLTKSAIFHFSRCYAAFDHIKCSINVIMVKSRSNRLLPMLNQKWRALVYPARFFPNSGANGCRKSLRSNTSQTITRSDKFGGRLSRRGSACSLINCSCRHSIKWIPASVNKRI